MLRVLLVDDEPFILRGMKELIDWKNEGFEIVGSAADGEEALLFLQNHDADLILADIKMPIMDGLELLRKLRISEKYRDIYFIILSGYADFQYAQEAIKYACNDYILKPVEKEKLVQALRKVRGLKNIELEKERETKKLENAYLSGKLISVIQGRSDSLTIEYVQQHIRLSEQVRYIEILIDGKNYEDDYEDSVKLANQKQLYSICKDYLQDDSQHCVMDASIQEKVYDVGFILCRYMYESSDIKEYLGDFIKYLREILGLPVIMIVGKEVKNLEEIAKSYSTTRMVRSSQGFREKKEIYYYEEEMQIHTNGIMLCKKSLDILLNAIEQNNHAEIMKAVDGFYEEMRERGIAGEVMRLNINYLLFQLLHLASELDDSVNQEEILRMISEGTFEAGILRGSKAHLCRVACEYGDYLAQMRKDSSRGILGKVEKEIRERYAENLTLKEFGEKYYLNGAYLGQLFRKKFGQSFKDYLNNCRIEQACHLLLRTDKKIYQIAEMVGYRDLDYFVNRFISVKGCTPAKFRKQAKTKDEKKADPSTLQDQYAYLTKTNDGRLLKSSTFYIKDESGTLAYIFSINYDITALAAADQFLQSFIQTQNPAEPSASRSATPQITHNVTELLDTLIEQAISNIGKPAALMTKDEKIKVVQYLNDAGAFLITKSGDKVASILGISKFTLYNYMDAGK